MRVGFGFDSHRLVAGRPLILGGVHVPNDRGLEGWSDADVLTHAVIDALCGAAGLGDIGTLFPAGDERFHGVSSLHLLAEVREMLAARGGGVVNVDVTVVAEEPRLAPFVSDMRRLLAGALSVNSVCVSIKAKTNEHMGFIGEGEGMAAFATILVNLAC